MAAPAQAKHLTTLEQLALHKEGMPAPHTVQAESGRWRPRVALYARISDDKEDESTGEADAEIGKRGSGVKRQLRVVHPLVDARGWEASPDDYVDNDFSAYKDRIIRPGFEQMLDDLRAGVIDGVACYDLDRLVRRPDDLERLIKIYDDGRAAGRAMVFASAQGDINLMSEDGIAFARILVVFANKASRDTARRVKLKHAENRDNLRQVGGTRPFGWDWEFPSLLGADGQPLLDASGEARVGERKHVLNSAEADLIRSTALQVIAAGAAHWGQITQAWNASGLRSPRGNKWQPQTVKGVLTSPRLAGWLAHRPNSKTNRVVIATHSQTGKLLRGTFDPVLTDDEYIALQTAVSSRTAGASIGQDGLRKYLLAGLVKCAACGAGMDGNARRDDRVNGVRHYYACRKTSRMTPEGEPACGTVSCSGIGLDELIVDLVWPRLRDAAREARRDGDPPHGDRLIELADTRARILREIEREELTIEAGLTALKPLEREQGELLAERGRWQQQQRVGRQMAALTREGFAQLDAATQRALVASQLAAVMVVPATRRTGRRFDHERVTPVWHGQPLPAVLTPR